MKRTTLRDRLLACAHRTVARFASELREDGSFGARHPDLASHHMAPALLLVAGRWHLADRVLGFVAGRFLQPDGDLVEGQDPEVVERPAHAGAWIAMAAQRLGRFEVSEPAWSHLKRYLHPDLGGGCAEGPFGGPAGGLSLEGLGALSGGPYAPDAGRHVEISTTALLGLCALHFGDGEIVHRAEQALVSFLDHQPDLPGRLLVSMDARGQLVGEGLVADATEQPWHAIGVAIAFLGLLHRVSASGEALRAARGYLDFALGCPTLAGELHAAQVAWGAAIVGEIAGAPRYLDASVAIARHILSTQGTAGLWRESEPPHVSFADSAERALCLLEIARADSIASRPERSRAEMTATPHRRGVGAWSLRQGRPGPEDDL